MWDSDIITKVNTESSDYPIYYLPHRPMVKESSASTKVRPVFDASAKSSNNVSSNDCINTGPSLLPNLVGVLLRVRRWQVAITADITKAFLQVKLRRKDQDVHRFLWDDLGHTHTMRFQSIMFRLNCSPFLLVATIRYHLATYPK